MATAVPQLVRVNESLWRVGTPAQRVLGHIEVTSTAHGDEYRAKRFHSATARFVEFGRFCRMDEAIDCVRGL